MIRARELHGRAVVDMDAAQKLGRIHELILDPNARRVAGLILSHGEGVLGGGMHVTIPAAAVHAIGPDAITVRHGAVEGADIQGFDGLPRLSDVLGRKVVSQSGRLLGRVSDVLLEEEDGRIFGYALTDHDGAAGALEGLFGGRRDVTHYLRAEADLRPGRDLVIAPDDAVAVLGTPAVDADARATTIPREPAPVLTSVGPTGESTSSRWGAHTHEQRPATDLPDWRG